MSSSSRTRENTALASLMCCDRPSRTPIIDPATAGCSCGLCSKWICVHLKTRSSGSTKDTDVGKQCLPCHPCQDAHKIRRRYSLQATPCAYRTSYTHTPDLVSPDSRSVVQTKPLPSGSSAGNSGSRGSTERECLDGICETNRDRDITTPM